MTNDILRLQTENERLHREVAIAARELKRILLSGGQINVNFVVRVFQDAERYRWIRNQNMCPWAETADEWFEPSLMDKAIDDEIARSRGAP